VLQAGHSWAESGVGQHYLNSGGLHLDDRSTLWNIHAKAPGFDGASLVEMVRPVDVSRLSAMGYADGGPPFRLGRPALVIAEPMEYAANSRTERPSPCGY
jgi:hypothetical protein